MNTGSDVERSAKMKLGGNRTEQPLHRRWSSSPIDISNNKGIDFKYSDIKIGTQQHWFVVVDQVIPHSLSLVKVSPKTLLTSSISICRIALQKGGIPLFLMGSFKRDMKRPLGKVKVFQSTSLVPMNSIFHFTR